MALLDEEQAYISYPQMGRRRAMPNTDVQMNESLLKGASYYPYDLLGSPVDIINMGLQPLGLGSEKPVMGSDWLQSLAQQYGLSQKPTGSNAENVARLAMSAMNPATGARAVGRAVEPTMQALAPKAAQMAEDYLRSIGGIADIVPVSNVQKTTRAITQFDPRFDTRVGEQERLKNLKTVIEGTPTPAQQQYSLVDFLGRPFITSMSDRTGAGGELVRINDVDLNRTVGLLGGQDYMFNNPGQVWASGQKPATDILELAQDLKAQTGQNPLYLPWRMTPSGGDFANMTYETMLNYAESALGKTDKKALDKMIKGYIPDWKGIDARDSIQQFRDTPDTVRKLVMKQIDKQFRDVGGLNIGEARLAVTDPKQLTGRTADIMNIGEIFADRPMIMQSGHPSYPLGVPGQGLGIIDKPRSIFELLPQMAKERGIKDPRNWSQADRRALEMKPYGGIIDEALLKALGY
jgi:hypothetical protein